MARSAATVDMKERRAFERSRQARLHPLDRYANTQANQLYHYKRHQGNSLHPRTAYGSFAVTGAKALPSLTLDDLGLDSDVEYAGPEEYDGFGDAVPEAAAPPAEVSLADLVRPVRTRKGIARDYELIPRVRPVMIIEDSRGGSNDSSTSSEDDDALDWELIPNAPKPKRSKSHTKPSYAAVASASK